MKTLRIIGSEETITIGKILCLGRNYAEHAKEMKAEVPSVPVIFLKPASAVISSGEDIVIPRISRDPHHEVELVIVIGKSGKHIPASNAFEHIMGYCIGLDMTLRDVQSEAKKKGLPWSVAKGFDTSAPLSEIIPSGKISDPQQLHIQCSVNGNIRQHTSTQAMIFTIPQIIEYVSSLFTLEQGDLIYTGTPEGVNSVSDGDIIEAELAGYAKIRHLVRFA